MGFNATLQACRFLQSGGSKVICDPFCGKGSVLAVANFLEMDAIGVEISTSRARKAEALQVSPEVGFSARAWLAGKDKVKKVCRVYCDSESAIRDCIQECIRDPCIIYVHTDRLLTQDLEKFGRSECSRHCYS